MACKKDDPAPNPPPELPPATQTGANTFGCYVNGKPFIQEERWARPTVGTQIGTYAMSVHAGNRIVDSLQQFNINVTFPFIPKIGVPYTTEDIKSGVWRGGYLTLRFL